MADIHQGLYDKFRVSRTDKRDKRGERHDGCEYFVLDLTHDPIARQAAREYARKAVGPLGRDLNALVNRIEPSAARAAMTAEEMRYYDPAKVMLTPEAAARARALEEAARITKTQNMFGTSRPSVWELISVADYIITGATAGTATLDEFAATPGGGDYNDEDLLP